MILRTVAAALLFTSMAAAQSPCCVAVESERITARDLAAGAPAFAGAPAGAPVGYSPLPGARRIFRAVEIAALAKRYGIAVDTPADICFEWLMEPLRRDSVVAAMKKGLAIDGAKVEVLELSRFPVPRGVLEFSRQQLATGQLPAVWRGSVVYAGNRKFAIWARVNITVPVQVVVATKEIKAGQTITREQVKLDERESAPLNAQLASSLEQVSGKVSRRGYTPGSQIWLPTLNAPRDVDRGDLVDVEVHSGASKLALTGKAESAGHTGDVISVRNLTSNRTFQARISGKNKVVVQTSGAQRN
ncbi:MAG: flagellar basal body P-ring formation chaperone FlgA [Bryobacteraceae bacterium]